MRDFMGLSYAEACAALGIEPKRTTTSSFPARRVHARTHPAHPVQMAPVPPAPAELPGKEWMASAAAFLDDCQRGLDCIPAAVVELCLHRGITLDSAAAHGLGWNASDRYVPRAAWGLPDGKDKDGNPLTKLLLPAGLVIATRRRAGVVGLTVRCLDEDRQTKGRAKYRQISGSANVPFVAGCAGLPLILLESALDAALAVQEGKEQIAALAFMGSTKPADADTDQFIKQAPLLLAAPDRDDAGEKAWARWSATYPHAHFAPVLHGKDLTEQHAAAHAWPLDYSIPTTGEWLTAVLSAIPTKMAHTGPMSHESTQHDQCATSGMKEAA
ncbi:hypothetical protein [Desulfovibrio sp.]|uniref:hypothetical protein n=1 Tax=Desulfovibrio sp. TaxID=885 RepID=UPI0035B3A3E0